MSKKSNKSHARVAPNAPLDITLEPDDPIEVTGSGTLLLDQEDSDVKEEPIADSLKRVLSDYGTSFFVYDKKGTYMRSYKQWTELSAMRSGYRRGLQALAHPNNHKDLEANTQRFLRITSDVSAHGPALLAGVDVEEVATAYEDLCEIKSQVNCTMLLLKRQLAVVTNLEQFLYNAQKTVNDRLGVLDNELDRSPDMVDFMSFFSRNSEQAQATKQALDKAVEASRDDLLSKVEDLLIKAATKGEGSKGEASPPPPMVTVDQIRDLDERKRPRSGRKSS